MSWALSSVGLERFLDTEEVAGSNPVEPTQFFLSVCSAVR